ncbi:MAG: hypothetical protein LBL56_03495, partial [Treponema sp.]|nr:hypothetical protein [Treponema sp.]
MGHQDREIRKEIEKIISNEDAPVLYPEILGLVFLRYICAAFEEHSAKTASRPDKKRPAAPPG